MQPRVYINWGQTRPAIVGVSCWNARERQRVILHWIKVSRRLLQALELWSSAQKCPFIDIWRNLSFRTEESLCVIPRTNGLYIVTFSVTSKPSPFFLVQFQEDILESDPIKTREVRLSLVLRGPFAIPFYRIWHREHDCRVTSNSRLQWNPALRPPR